MKGLSFRDPMRCITSGDQRVGHGLDYVEAQNLDDNTIIINISYQGFSPGEHRLYAKHIICQKVLCKPLLTMYPKEIRK